MQPMIETPPQQAPDFRNAILQSQQQSWNKFSAGWEKWDDFTMRFLEPQGTALLEALQIAEGSRVLDIATGTGDPGLTLASTRRGVRVTALDASEGMLRVAQKKATRQGLDNFETRLGDACALDFTSESFEAITCRLGFMFFPEPQLAAREMARVLRPGGVVATTVWAPPDYNTWLTTLLGIARRYVDVPTPPPSAPGLFRCAAPGAVADLFESAGLSVERTEMLTGELEYRTVDEYLDFMGDVVPPVVAAFAAATPDVLATIRAEVLAALSTSVGTTSWGAHLVVARK